MDSSSFTAHGQDVQALFNEGLRLYQEGNLDGAINAFEAAWAQNPSNDAILSFVENATVAKIYEMLRSEEPRVSGIARQLLQSSRAEIVQRGSDEAEIQAAIQEVLASENQEQLILMIHYAARYGRNLVPYLIPLLADTNLAHRTVGITWIRRVGVDAVPVLQAARKHPDATVRRNVAELLGVRSLRHPVSLATLKAFMEADPAVDVQETAEVSLKAILSDLDGQQGAILPAKEYFLRNAYEQYYLNPYQNPFASTAYVPKIYKLEGDRIVEEVVADFQLSDRMAQQALYDALDLDAGYLLGRILLVCNDAAQVLEYDMNVEYYTSHESFTDIKELLAGQKPYFDYILRNRLVATPSGILYQGLMQALEDGKSAVARKLIEVIRETNRRGRVPDALVRALEDSNSRLVRTAAAVTLAHWNPLQKDFDAGEQVIDILGDAVYASGVRTVQKVMGNARLANRLDEMFRELNVESYSRIPTVSAGYDAVVSSPPDVVFTDESVQLDLERPGAAPVNFFVSELRKNYRSANVPVVVLVPPERVEAARELYESDERKVLVVPDDLDRLGLDRNVFKVLFQDSDDAKALATRLAVEAGEAINFLASVPTRMPRAKVVPVLIKVLLNRPDEVRVPCIRALGNMRATEAARDLAVVFSRTENAQEIRVEAMKALGMVLEADPQGADEELLGVIQEGMAASDLELRAASWYAFSNARAAADIQLQELVRVKPPEAGAVDTLDSPPVEEEPAVPGTEEAPVMEEPLPGLEGLEEEEGEPPSLEEEEEDALDALLDLGT